MGQRARCRAGLHQAGKPAQNSYVERFNRTYRDEILNLYMFRSLTEVRDLTSSWLRQYNEERPHDALGDQSLAGYLAANSGDFVFHVRSSPLDVLASRQMNRMRYVDRSSHGRRK